MTIDEAIKHCEKVAKQNDNSAELFRQKKEASRFLEKEEAENAESGCRECAADHRQLAEWLRELKYYRNEIEKHRTDKQPVDRWISVDERLPEEVGYYLVIIGNDMLYSIDIAEYSENRWHKDDKVIYWQDLPDYPKSITE